jgi:ABC-type phosphate/phosphonate transport system permease subunit
MKYRPETEWDVILVKTSGLALITVALTWLPQALAAVVKIVSMMYVSRTYSQTDSKLDELVDTYNMQMTSTAMGELVAFLLLIGIARWILSYPKFLRGWLQRPTHVDVEPQEAEQDVTPNA